MTNSLIRPLACLLLMVALFCQASISYAQSDEPISAKYTSQKAFFLLAIHPKNIAEKVGADNENVKYILKMTQRMSGMNIGSLEQVLIQMDTAGYEDESEQAMTILMRFAEKLDVEKVMSKMFGGEEGEKVEKDGFTFYKPPFGDAPCFYVAGGNTLVMANEATLKSAMENDDGKSGAALSKQLFANDDICAAFDMSDEKAVDILRDMMSQMPAEVDGADEIMESAKSGSVRIRLDSDTPFVMEIESADQAAADKLKKLCEDSIDNANDSLDELDGQLGAVPPNIADQAEKLVEELRDAVEGMSVSSSGKTVTMKVSKKGGMKTAATAMVDMMAEGLKMMEAFMPEEDF